MPSIIHPQERQHIHLLILPHSRSISILPLNITRIPELIPMCPVRDLRPLFTTSPVADEIFVTAVDQHVDPVLEEVRHIILETQHPIPEEESVDELVAVSELPTGDVERLDDVWLCKELIHWAEVVAKRWLRAGESDVIEVECGVCGET